MATATSGTGKTQAWWWCRIGGMSVLVLQKVAVVSQQIRASTRRTTASITPVFGRRIYSTPIPAIDSTTSSSSLENSMGAILVTAAAASYVRIPVVVVVMGQMSGVKFIRLFLCT